MRPHFRPPKRDRRGNNSYRVTVIEAFREASILERFSRYSGSHPLRRPSAPRALFRGRTAFLTQFGRVAHRRADDELGIAGVAWAWRCAVCDQCRDSVRRLMHRGDHVIYRPARLVRTTRTRSCPRGVCLTAYGGGLQRWSRTTRRSVEASTACALGLRVVPPAHRRMPTCLLLARFVIPTRSSFWSTRTLPGG